MAINREIPIKFRGLGEDGEYHCGKLVSFGDRYVINEAAGKGYAVVKPESVAQLCAVNKDGRELYEGDELVDAYGNRWMVGLQTVAKCGESLLVDINKMAFYSE